MTEIPTAAQAARIVDIGLSAGIQTEWEAIAKAVLDALNKGERNASVSGHIHTANRAKLVEKGYTVSTGQQYNETYTNISW